LEAASGKEFRPKLYRAERGVSNPEEPQSRLSNGPSGEFNPAVFFLPHIFASQFA
jgi:hypothetical protein